MKNRNLLYIHGTFGDPNENWVPWLKSKIESMGITFISPKFPTPEGQSLESWNEILSHYEKYIDEDTIFVGHSLGPAFILNFLEKTQLQISASFLVAPFIGFLNNPEFDELNSTFTNKDFDWNKIKKQCPQFFIYHSDNDPYVSQDKSEFVAKNVNAVKYEIIKGGGHLNEAAGFTEFPLLFEQIKDFIINA